MNSYTAGNDNTWAHGCGLSMAESGDRISSTLWACSAGTRKNDRIALLDRVFAQGGKQSGVAAYPDDAR